MVESTKGISTVTPDDQEIGPRISGVTVRFAVTHVDERGERCEIYNPAWNVHGEPLVYVYQSSVRPGRIKGWV